MISIKNLKKDYTTYKSAKVEALKGINLEFSNSGLHFVLGTSGSGKSTLLNLLGGFDKPTSGSILVNNVPLESLKEEQLDNYRNKVIGFVFQEFNIIYDLTIKDNLLIGTKIQNNDNEDVESILTKVGLEGYENRYPQELSGGQLQRVALARALIKHSDIILADEPTGNLDLKTGKEIIELLKEISKDHLVIVVSHNVDFANEYADRIVHMQDGRIIKDEYINENIDVSSKEHINENLNKASHLSLKYVAKMSLHNLGIKKFRTIITCFVMIVAFLGFSLSISFLQFDNSTIVTKAINNYDVTRIQLSRMSIKDDYSVDYQDVISPFILEEIENKYDISYMVDNQIKKTSDLIEMKIELYDNYLPLDEEGFYVSDYRLEKYYFSEDDRNSVSLFDPSKGTSENYKYKDLSVDDVVGKYINYEGDQIKVLGIYKSDLELAALKWNPDAIYPEIPENYLYSSNIYTQDICSRENSTYLKQLKANTSLSRVLRLDYGDYFHSFSADYEKEYTNVSLYKRLPDFTNYIALDDNQLTLVNDSQFTSTYALNENEIYLTYQEYKEIFNLQESELNYVQYDAYHSIIGTTLKKPLDHLGKKIILKIGNKYSPKNMEEQVYTVKGVIFRESLEKSRNGSIITSAGVFDNYYECLLNRSLLINVSSINNIAKFLNDMENKYSLMGRMQYSHDIFDFQVELLTTLNYIFLPVAIICLIVIIFLVITLVNNSVETRKKENGILKALGMRTSDLKRIYLLEIGIVSIITYIPVVIGANIAVNLLNSLFVSSIESSLTLLFFNLWNYPMFFVLLIGMNLLMTFIVLHLTFKKDIVSIIKHEI